MILKNPYNQLFLAIQKGDFDKVKFIIELGFNVNYFRGNGVTNVSEKITPLIFSIISYKNDDKIVNFLIKSGARINQPTKNRETPLHIAVKESKFKLVKLLLDNGANINQLNIWKETPIFIASKNNHLEIVDLLIKYGADLNIPDCGWIMPLLIATKDLFENYYMHDPKKQIKLLKLLIKNGAKLIYEP